MQYLISYDGSREVMKSFYFQSFYSVSNLCNISHELRFFLQKDLTFFYLAARFKPEIQAYKPEAKYLILHKTTM